MNTVECYSYEQCVGTLVCSELKSGAVVLHKKSRSGDEIRSALTEYFSLRLILTYLPLIKLQTHLPNTKGGEQSSSECLALAKPALSPTARKTGTLSCNLRVLQVAMARKISISSSLQEGN